MVRKWLELTRDEVAAIDKDNAIVLLPMAATEQHGAHLPVGTDTTILATLIDRFCATQEMDGCTVLFAPQLPVGKSNEHMGFAGTLTFSATTYYALLFDLAKSIERSGFKKLVLLNSHGGNYDMANLISRDIRVELGMEVFVFDWWFTDFWQKGLEGVKESGLYGVFHACELETSLMLAAQPDTVHMELAVDEEPAKSLQDNHFVSVFGPVTVGWKTSDVTQSGVIGAPSYATKEKGEKLFSYAVNKLADMLREFMQIHY